MSLLIVTQVCSPVSEALTSDALHLILLPTEQCNLRCTYCYEEFRLAGMSEEVVTSVERFLSRRVSGLRRLSLSWFGGEPLLNRAAVVRLLAHAGALRALHPGLAFHSDMTTNGVELTPERMRELHALGVVRFQITLDGPESEHDRRRIRRSGCGTFARIWSNLLGLHALDLPFTILLRLHVDRENAPALPDFLVTIANTFRGDPRFRLIPKLVARWGGARDATLPVFERAEGLRVVSALVNHARTLGVPLFESPAENSICYAARANAFVIRADGRVNKCTIALEAPENQVGRLHPDGRLILDPARALPWMRGLFDGDAGARHCPMTGLVGRPAAATSP